MANLNAFRELASRIAMMGNDEDARAVQAAVNLRYLMTIQTLLEQAIVVVRSTEPALGKTDVIHPNQVNPWETPTMIDHTGTLTWSDGNIEVIGRFPAVLVPDRQLPVQTTPPTLTIKSNGHEVTIGDESVAPLSIPNELTNRLNELRAELMTVGRLHATSLSMSVTRKEFMAHLDTWKSEGASRASGSRMGRQTQRVEIPKIHNFSAYTEVWEPAMKHRGAS